MDTSAWFPILGVISAGILAVIACYVLILRFTKVDLPLGTMVRKKKDASLAIGALLLVIAVMGGGITEMQGWAGQAQASIEGGGSSSQDQNEASNCDSDGIVSFKVDIQNSQNTASLEEYDAGVTCVGPSNSFAITDTTDPTADTSNVVCGDTYTCYATSTAGAAGDGSAIKQILMGNGQVVNGNLQFKADGSAMSFQLGIPQRGVTQARMWDNKNAAWIYDSGDATASDYETDGAVFTSTTDNATEMAVGASGEVSVKMYFRSTAVDEVLNDGRGILIAVDAASATWDAPTMILDGSVLSDCKESLNANEKIALSGYEHVYCYSGTKGFTQTGEGVLEVDIFALAGINPATGGTDDLQIDLIARGQKASALDGSKFIQSAYDDTASHAVMLQVDDYSIDIS